MPRFTVPVSLLLALLVACSDTPEAEPPKEVKLVEVLGLEPLEDLSKDPNIVEVNLRASEATAEFSPGKATKVLAYNDSTPAPMLHIKLGDRVIVHFTNDLQEKTTIHWHGLRIVDTMDGSQRIQDPVLPGETFTYDFTPPDAGTFWYHSHVSTIEQLDRGLYGAIVVHEKEPPKFTHERVFLLDDIRLDKSFQITAFEKVSGPDIGMGRTGNILLTNGHPDGIAIEGQHGAIERWRLINAANARTMSLSLEGASFRIIGTDGGFVPTPFTKERIEIAPGQRTELEVRFDKPDAAAAKLINWIPYLKPDDTLGENPFTMITSNLAGDVVAEEPVYPGVEFPATNVQAKTIDLALAGGLVAGLPEFTINGVAGHADHGGLGIGPFTQGEPVKFTLKSSISPEHPFHLHGQFFQVIARDGKPVNEPGLRDTVRVRGAQPVTILTYFENPGRWMIHCHIAEHGENGMMSEIQVLPAATN